METYNNYLIVSSVSISIFYLAYLYFFRKEQNFKIIRIFLLSAILFSLILPLNPFTINLPCVKEVKPFIENTKPSYKPDVEAIESIKPTELPVNQNIKAKNVITEIDYKSILFKIYLIVGAFILARLILSVCKILFFYINSEKTKYQKHTLVLLDKRIIAFSFFNWIFVDKLNTNSDLEQIIKHEKIHASQYHSIDLLLSELLVATMWFNPFTWMLKKALQQVHEFLADEGVINSGFDRLEYQTLLVNQAAEERLVAVSSNFSYSLIKKRMMMMSETKKHGGTGIKFLVLVPIVIALFLLTASFKKPAEARLIGVDKLNISSASKNKRTAFANKVIESGAIAEKTELNTIEPKDTIKNSDLIVSAEPIQEYITAVSPTKMNVLYIGVDNPVSIAVTNAKSGKITAEIDNGTITGKDGNYTVRVKEIGYTTITVKVDNKVVSKQKFRAKQVPDPVVIVKGKWNVHEFTNQELVDAGEIVVLMANFDFELNFEVVGFSLSAITMGGFMEEAKTEGNKFSKNQIALINQVKSGSKIYMEEIQVQDPDGTIRNLGGLTFKIK